MTAVKQSPEGTVTQHLRVNNTNRKTTSLKAFEEPEIDRESYGSSSEDVETYSPKSVVLRTRKNVNVDVFGRRARNQIERIRAEDSHLGEDIGECLIVKICGVGHEEVVILSRLASPLGGKVAGRMNTGR